MEGQSTESAIQQAYNLMSATINISPKVFEAMYRASINSLCKMGEIFESLPEDMDPEDKLRSLFDSFSVIEDTAIIMGVMTHYMMVICKNRDMDVLCDELFNQESQ